MKLLIVLALISACTATFEGVDHFDNIKQFHAMHSQNVQDARSVVMRTDLNLHHQQLMQQIVEYTNNDEFRSQTVQDCVQALVAFVSIANTSNAQGGCADVFQIFDPTSGAYSNVAVANPLISAHCAGTCHTRLTQSIVTVAQQCTNLYTTLGGNFAGYLFIQRLKAAIMITEMPCIVDDNDASKYCMSSIVQLRHDVPDTGASVPTADTLNAICTPCVVKIFSAAATFAPDYARVSFLILAANCWTFNGKRCSLQWQALTQTPDAVSKAENGTSQAWLEQLCDPCIRIFLRRAAILYSDPVLQGQGLAIAAVLWQTLHYADIACFARAATVYCIRELYPDVQAGRWDSLRIGGSCYNEFIDSGSTTCPVGTCRDQVVDLLTAHGCCSVALFKIFDFKSYINGDRDRDNSTTPSNIFLRAIKDKCPTQVAAISNYCTAVARTVVVTLRNIRFAYYAAHYVEFHRLVAMDIAQFLGRVLEDVQAQNTMGTQLQHSGFTTLAGGATVDGVSISVSVMPANDDDGSQIQSSLDAGLAGNTIPFNNAASNFAFLADPTQAVTATSSAGSAVASLLVVALLVVANLL